MAEMSDDELALKPDRSRLLTFIKEYGSLTMSAIALTLSISTLYLNFRNLDDFRVVFSVGTGLTHLSEGNHVLSPKQTFTFVNSGTRQIAVLAVELHFEFGEKLEFRECKSDAKDQFIIELDTEPFIVKPGELAVRRLTPNIPVAGTEEDDWRLTEAGNIVFPIRENQQLLTCARFQLVTPDRIMLKVAAPIWLTGLTEERDGLPKLVTWLPGYATSLVNRSDLSDIWDLMWLPVISLVFAHIFWTLISWFYHRLDGAERLAQLSHRIRTACRLIREFLFRQRNTTQP